MSSADPDFDNRPAEHAGARPGLDPNRETVEQWLEALSGWALDHLDGLETAPAQGLAGAVALDVAAEVSKPITEAPLDGGVEAVLDVLARAVPASFNTAGPGYLAYVPGGGLVAAGIADLVSNWTNRFTGLTPAAPALVRLEADVLRWLCAEFGYSDRAYGILTSGGSAANFSGFVAARVDRLGDDGDYREAIAYTSGQAHHSVAKSLGLAGIPKRNLRQVPTDAAFRMRPDALYKQVQADRAAGRRPFLVVASAGTTNTGAVDPLPALADVCAKEELWLHVDGAYGGAFVLCDEGKRRLTGIERADSIAFDPHKGMFLPYGTGCLLARDGAALRRAHSAGADYLQDVDALDRDGESPSPHDYGPELSRDFRGLRLWLPLMLHGAAPFRTQLQEKLTLAERFTDGLRAHIERGLPAQVVAAPQLSTVAFRLSHREGESIDAWNARNQQWLRAINERGRAYLSSTLLPLPSGDSAFTLRVCVLSFRTHAERIDACLEDLVATA